MRGFVAGVHAKLVQSWVEKMTLFQNLCSFYKGRSLPYIYSLTLFTRSIPIVASDGLLRFYGRRHILRQISLYLYTCQQSYPSKYSFLWDIAIVRYPYHYSKRPKPWLTQMGVSLARVRSRQCENTDYQLSPKSLSLGQEISFRAPNTPSTYM